MDWLDHLAIQIAGVSALLIALGIIFQKGLIPLWKGIVALVHAVETLDSVAKHTADLPDALPVLMDIAEEFKPNDGATLRDRVDRLELGLRNITQQLEELCKERTRSPRARTRLSDIINNKSDS